MHMHRNCTSARSARALHLHCPQSKIPAQLPTPQPAATQCLQQHDTGYEGPCQEGAPRQEAQSAGRRTEKWAGSSNLLSTPSCKHHMHPCGPHPLSTRPAALLRPCSALPCPSLPCPALPCHALPCPALSLYATAPRLESGPPYSLPVKLSDDIFGPGPVCRPSGRYQGEIK